MNNKLTQDRGDVMIQSIINHGYKPGAVTGWIHSWDCEGAENDGETSQCEDCCGYPEPKEDN